jgi:hypothetical protein
MQCIMLASRQEPLGAERLVIPKLKFDITKSKG